MIQARYVCCPLTALINANKYAYRAVCIILSGQSIKTELTLIVGCT